MIERWMDRLQVVVIEDDEDARANLTDILELENCQVRAVAGVGQALALRDWNDVHAVLLDRQLRDGTADTLLPQLRRLAPQAAVIIVTAYADLDSTIAALRHGAYDYILKPINPDALRASLRRLRDLLDARRQAVQSERLAAIGQMIAGLAHESRNALQRSQSCLEMLRMEVEDRPSALQLCDRVQKALDDLTRLFEDVRSYAAPIVLHRSQSELPNLWRRAWQDMEHRRREKQIQLLEQIDCSDSCCLVDSFAIAQVFRNLLENAVDVSPQGSSIFIHCREAMLRGQPACAVSVADQGPGIDPAHRPRIFEPFFTTKNKGTGLGLAIARRIVEAHGGRLLLGNPPRGAEFIVVLPRSPAEKEPQENIATPHEAQGAGMTPAPKLLL